MMNSVKMTVKSGFDEQGFVAPLQLLTPHQAQEAREKFEQLQEKMLVEFGEAHRFKLHLLERWLYDIVCNKAILDTVEQILGPDLLCWSSDFFCKPAFTPSFVSLHQDTTYAGLSPTDHIVNVWLALTPSTSQNGCLQVVPGTHKLGQLHHNELKNGENLLFFGQTVELPDDITQRVDLQLLPGQASLHHMAIVHGSQPNNSSIARIGLVLRYISPDVRQSKAVDSATLVRGSDNYGHFIHEPMPSDDWSETSVNAFLAALKRPSALG
jgi:ectoine hydroxylase-related dioxygenase (phytanoyl-CoA dioxygenase family)